jgi:histidinol-phosphate aminotransferase
MSSDIDFRSLANHHIRNITPYQPGKPIEEVERELGIPSVIKLASNENPLGASPFAIAAAQKALTKAHLYPDAGCYDLKQMLSKFLHVQPTQLTIGNGSENILEIITKAYLPQNSAAILSQYAFLTIQLLIASFAAEMITIPAKDFGHDIRSMIAAINEKTRIIFVVNPNNPTGTYTSADDMRLLLESVPPHILIVVDEAYHEYIDCADYLNMLPMLDQYPNLVITRTFSKAYGLAGMRLGYAISSLEIADILNRARLPFNVNSAAGAAAVAALQDQNHIVKTIALNKQGMQQLIDGFKKMQMEYIPSLGNFITINIKQDARAIYQKLLYEGVIVRPLLAYDLPTHLRVTIGTADENDKLLRALHTTVAK